MTHYLFLLTVLVALSCNTLQSGKPSLSKKRSVCHQKTKRTHIATQILLSYRLQKKESVHGLFTELAKVKELREIYRTEEESDASSVDDFYQEGPTTPYFCPTERSIVISKKLPPLCTQCGITLPARGKRDTPYVCFDAALITPELNKDCLENPHSEQYKRHNQIDYQEQKPAVNNSAEPMNLSPLSDERCQCLAEEQFFEQAN